MNYITSTAVIALCTIVESAAAQGAVRTWHAPTAPGGEFSDPLRWRDQNNQSGAPGELDTAVFNTPSTFNVTFIGGDQITDRLIIRRGFITFLLGAYQYDLMHPLNNPPALVIGSEQNDSAGLTLDGGAMMSSFTDLGQSPGSFGMFTLRSGASLGNEWQFRIGNQGAGVLNVDDGTLTSYAAYIGQGAGSFGQATVSGESSEWTMPGGMRIGAAGYGELRIRNGAYVACGEAIIGQVNTGYGVVSVEGPGTTWEIDAMLDIGMTGPGVLDISNGATVINGVYATISPYHPTNQQSPVPHGWASVRGQGSQWIVNGNLHLGFAGNTIAELTLSSGGSVSVAGNVTRAAGTFAEQTRIYLDLSDAEDYISTAALTAGGTVAAVPVTVSLVGGFVPQLGDVFRVVSADAINGAVVFTLPALEEGVVWQIVQNGGDIELRVSDPHPADLNGDGVVDVLDMLLLFAAWGPCPARTSECPADLNGDGSVDVLDMLILFANWG